ncbi:MAG: hypothetical protein HY329_08290 [Chloroflexi bacterium]|nr:hypothetical protein [Chloroflexota bacterium]
MSGWLRGELSVDHTRFDAADPVLQVIARRLGREYSLDPANPDGVAEVRHTGKSMLRSEILDAELAAYIRDPEHLRLIRTLAPRSAMITPVARRIVTNLG